MIEQYSNEWFGARLGKITSSTIWHLIVEPQTKKEGDLSKTTKDYLMTKIAERLTGVQRSHDSAATTHGIQLENEALEYYANKTGNVVGEAGYIEMIAGLYGGTPDGFVNDDGLIQVKCPWNYVNHLNYGVINDVEVFKKKYREYYWQCQSDMLVSNREFCDFVSYCPDMPEKHKMSILRLPANLDDMQLLVSRLDLAGKFIEETMYEIENQWIG
jgi:hypothetical protein